MKSVILTLTIFLGFQTLGFTQNFHTNPLCWDDPRIIFPEDEQTTLEAWESAHRLTHVQESMPEEYHLSPNNAYAFYLETLKKEGTHRLFIFNERPRLTALELEKIWSIQDIKWINEKLIYLRVWLGRIAGVDVLFDVEQERFLHVESFRDGEIAMQQRKESCKNDKWKDTEVCKYSCHKLEDHLK